MADKLRIEIVGRLAPVLLRLASEQGRDPNEIMAEALELYLRGLGVDTGPDLDEPVMEMYAGPPEGEFPSRGRLPALLDGMSSRFDLDADQSLRIAVEEQHAFREERRERQRRRTRR